MELPDLKEIEEDIFIPNLEIGDAVLFNFKIVHILYLIESLEPFTILKL